MDTLAYPSRSTVSSPVARGVARVPPPSAIPPRPTKPAKYARFANWLTHAMESVGVTNADLVAAGVRHSSISRWRSGEERPSVDFLRKIAPVLHKTHGELIVAAGYSTPEELGMVSTEPAGNPRLAALVKDVNREISHASVSDADADRLVSVIVDGARRVLKFWREVRPPRKEPKMRDSKPGERP